MKNFSRFILCGAVVVAMLGMASTQSFGEVLYGPVTFDPGNQGGSYYKYGPDSGDINLTFPDDGSGNFTLCVQPTVNGAALVHDEGLATTLSSYTVSADCQWQKSQSRSRFSLMGYAISGQGAIGLYPYANSSYVFSCYMTLLDETNPLGNANPEHTEDWNTTAFTFFKASDQSSGDGVTDLLFGNPYHATMAINDTGDNATSTFTYTWNQEGVGGVDNIWIAEATFAEIRAQAVQEAINKSLGAAMEQHVGDLFDLLVSNARSSTETTDFAYFTFANGEIVNWDNTTVTAVPEPSTMVLLAGLLIGLLIWRKK